MGDPGCEDARRWGVGLMPLVWTDPIPPFDPEARIAELEQRVARIARRVKALEDAATP